MLFVEIGKGLVGFCIIEPNHLIVGFSFKEKNLPDIEEAEAV